MLELGGAFATISDQVTLIDPAWIDEYRFYTRTDDAGCPILQSDARWPITSKMPLRPLTEVENLGTSIEWGKEYEASLFDTALTLVRGWVLVRDYRLISQSSGLVVFRPFHLSGDARVSRGVLSELKTFAETQTDAPCIVIHTEGDFKSVPSPQDVFRSALSSIITEQVAKHFLERIIVVKDAQEVAHYTCVPES